MSPIDAPPRVGPAEPHVPERKRRIDNAVIFGATAQPTFKIVNSEKLTKYTTRRPWISERGARNNGPRPRPKTYNPTGRLGVYMLVKPKS